MERPTRRELGLLWQPMDDEVLVFDAERNRAHSLNSTAAKVWLACDGQRDLDGLMIECGIDGSTLALALGRLRGAHLLDDAEPGDVEPRSLNSTSSDGVSRRVMIRRSVTTGAALGVAIPVIRSITAPSPALAVSTHKGKAGQPCTMQSQCSGSSVCQTSVGSCQRGVGASCSHTFSCLRNHTASVYPCVGGHCGHCNHNSQCPAGYNCSGSICKHA